MVTKYTNHQNQRALCSILILLLTPVEQQAHHPLQVARKVYVGTLLSLYHTEGAQ